MTTNSRNVIFLKPPLSRMPGEAGSGGVAARACPVPAAGAALLAARSLARAHCARCEDRPVLPRHGGESLGGSALRDAADDDLPLDDCSTCQEMHWLCWAAEQSTESIFITDRHGRIVFLNSAFEKLTGYGADEVLGKTPGCINSGWHGAEFYARMWAALRTGEVFSDVFVNRKKNGDIFHEEKTIRPLRQSDGRVTHFISTGRDVTGRLQEIERLGRLASHDSLTGLPNARRFMERLNQAAAHAALSGRGFTLLYIDVDDFKSINDRYGHATGNAMLQTVSARLRQAIGDQGMVARLSGDEFAAVLPDLFERRASTVILEKLFGAFAVPVHFDGQLISLSISVGVNICRTAGDAASEVLNRADMAMYAAKRRGGAGYAYFEADSMTAPSRRNRDWRWLGE